MDNAGFQENHVGNNIASSGNASGKYRKRKFKKVLKWRAYDSTREPLNFKREMVTLFWPFNNEELDILDNDTYVQLYDDHFAELYEKCKEYDSGLSFA